MKNRKADYSAKSPDEVDKLTFRLWAPYSSLIAERAREANMKPSQFARLATMAFADANLLQLGERLSRIESELIRLRKDFNDAVND